MNTFGTLKQLMKILIRRWPFCDCVQVTVLKLQIKYEDAGSLVPWELHIFFISVEGEESENYKAR